MWLDRLAAQHQGAVSQPNSRPITPLPSRSSSSLGPYTTSHRPGLKPRESTLSLVSNESSTSLLASSNRTNGSALKQSTTAEDAEETEEAEDPEEVLAKILGPPPENIEAVYSGCSIEEQDLELDYEFDGLSLRELAQNETGLEGQDVYRSQTIEEYERDKAKFEELHRSIRTCDDILSSVETNLGSFRNDLAAVSADIETLQARSTALNVRLDNRRAVEKGLAPVVEELSVSPHTVSKIAEGQIDDGFVRALADIDRRAGIYQKQAKSSQGKAFSDLEPLLEKLAIKAVERIRDFLVAQIKALRSPHVNSQTIQQQGFLRFKDLYVFLHAHQPKLAEEICLAYRNTIRWYYLNQFTRYKKALDKIKLHLVDKSDVLGQEDHSRKTTVLVGSRLAGPPHDAFNLGRRIDTLRSASQVAMPSYLAEEDDSMHYLELPFRNFNLALVDNATAEFTFLSSFFRPALSLATVSRHFAYVFEPVFQLGQSLTRQLISDTFDGLGLLLCIRLNQHLAFELQRRRVGPAVDGYINGTAMSLWPRLQVVMDAHCESVRALTSALPTRAASASMARNASAAPHVVTQRFGQLLQGVLSLSADAGDDEPVVASMNRLRSEVEAFLTKYSSATFGADRRKRERFLYNNYSLILTIIGDVNGKLALEHQEHFDGLKSAFQEAA